MGHRVQFSDASAAKKPQVAQGISGTEKDLVDTESGRAWCILGVIKESFIDII